MLFGKLSQFVLIFTKLDELLVMVAGNGISVLGVVLAEGRAYILDTVKSTSSPAQTVAGPASSSSSNERPVLGSVTLDGVNLMVLNQTPCSGPSCERDGPCMFII